ncbi:MAG: NUDIX domain-containing protein [bacterium]|nr:NUDIX domain-containing protein [bacterium]
MRLPIRAVGIVIKENKVLLIEREQDGKHYFVFPGGGVEEGETVEEAVKRELLEETTLEVEIQKLLYSHFYLALHKGHSVQHFYLCRHLRGVPKLGDFEEMDKMKSGKGYFNPLWINLEKLPDLLLYPLEIRDNLLEDIKINFKENPKEEKIDLEHLRQKI